MAAPVVGWEEQRKWLRAPDLSQAPYNPRPSSEPLIGATPGGKRELAVQTGVRESAQRWRELLVGVERHGLENGSDLASAAVV